MKILNLEHALEVFETKSVKHGISTKNGEPSKKINNHYNGIIEAVKWLHSNNQLIKLNKFYNSSNLDVRSWAVSFLLEIDTQNAEKVLENLVAINYSDAKYVLMEWKAGTLDMDFFKA